MKRGPHLAASGRSVGRWQRSSLIGLLLAACAVMSARSQDRDMMIDARGTPWEAADLGSAPAVSWGVVQEGIQRLEFEGADYKGRPTRVTALRGVPSLEAERLLPGVVLVHGGAGRPYPDWVRQWMDRGYAAIAPDVGGQEAPTGAEGPRGYGGYAQIADPLPDQWAYHAINSIIKAHTLLRNTPGVDPERIAVIGVSWGAFLSLTAVSIDHRFQAAALIYECGFRVDDDAVLQRFAEMSPALRERWTTNWDPSSYLAKAKAPLLFVNGTEDRVFRPVAYHRTYRLVPEPQRTIKLVADLAHGQQVAMSIPEVARFVDQVCRDGEPLLRIGAVSKEGERVASTVDGASEIVAARWWFSEESEKTSEVRRTNGVELRTTTFRELPAQVGAGGRIEATVTPHTKLGYFEVEDASGVRTTSEFMILNSGPR